MVEISWDIIAYYITILSSIATIAGFLLTYREKIINALSLPEGKRYPFWLKVMAILAIVSWSAYYFSIPLTVEITDPLSGSIVQTPVNLKGTVSGNILSKDIPQGYYLWVLVSPTNMAGLIYPQAGSGITPIVDGKWSWTAQLGGKSYEKFNILVALVDTKTDELFKRWVENGKITTEYPAIPIPKDAKILDQITVDLR